MTNTNNCKGEIDELVQTVKRIWDGPGFLVCAIRIGSNRSKPKQTAIKTNLYKSQAATKLDS
jgi:hypothetical protein